MRMVSVISSIILFSSLSAQNVSAVDTDTIFYRKDCSSHTGSTCFTDITAMQDWLWNTRNPTAAAPVTVKIGPGVYDNELFVCNNKGNVSFIGSGVNSTIFKTGGNVAQITNCENISFQDMTLDASTGSYAVRWMGGGSSRWVNVDVLGMWNAWRDQIEDCNGAHPVHYWFDSRLISNQSFEGAYLTECGESWFYASEIRTELGPSTGTAPRASGVVDVGGNAMVQMFGSSVRATVPDPAAVNAALSLIIGVTTQDSGTFHMHGGIVGLNLVAATQTIDVIGIRSDSSGVVHTPGTAFTLNPGGSGRALRATTGVNSSGKVFSPFLWQAGSTLPPLDTSYPAVPAVATSVTGNDLFVETDCDVSGNCDTAAAGSQIPHLMIYAPACDTATSSTDTPWFDVAMNACRGQ